MREIRMTAIPPAFAVGPSGCAAPQPLFGGCLVLCWVNVALLLNIHLCGQWVYDANGIGIPTDFVNVWAAGRLALEGHPAQAWDWSIQKQVELAILQRDFVGYFAWHYPPLFLFVASLLAQFPYGVAFIGWALLSMLLYLAVMRAIVGRSFGLVLAAACPALVINMMVGQNGFLTAALVGGTLALMPKRPVLAGICLGLLSYKPQYGLLFPVVLIAASQWATFVTAGVVTVALAFASWLAFGSDSWQAFFHWMPMFSQAFLTEGQAPWWKLQSIFALIRYFGGTETMAWAAQCIMVAAVATSLVVLWRSHARYSLKAAALALGTLLTTPYLFMYDMMVLVIPVAYLVRIGLARGFRPFELPALACAFVLILSYIFLGLPVGFAANLLVAGLILRRVGLSRRTSRAPRTELAAAA
jgi:arabinofuranan 3-O-arabinosyltransferase